MIAEHAVVAVDRRRDLRFDVKINAVFSLKDARGACTVVNLSASGLLLKVNDARHFRLSECDAGEVCRVTIEPGRTRQGTILRVFTGADAGVVALSFI